MNALDTFTSGTGATIRVTTDENGEPWFVIADVARALELTNATVAAGSLDLDDLSSTEVIDSLGRTQTARTASEAGLYQLVFQSRKPEAKSFKRWVTHEVLPQIRRTGSYNTPPALPRSYADALRELAATVERSEALEAANAELTPRAEAWDELASADGDYAVADAAKILARRGVKTGPARLFHDLNNMRWIFRGADGKLHAYASAVDAGYLAEKPQSHHHPRTGELVLDAPQIRVTLRGLERLRVRLGSIETGEAA